MIPNINGRSDKRLADAQKDMEKLKSIEDSMRGVRRSLGELKTAVRGAVLPSSPSDCGLTATACEYKSDAEILEQQTWDCLKDSIEDSFAHYHRFSMKPNPDQLELPFEETTPKSTVNDMLRRGATSKDLAGPAREPITVARVEPHGLYEIDVTTFQEAAEGKKVVIVTTGPQLRDAIGTLPAIDADVIPEYIVSVKLNEVQLRKLEEVASFHHLDKPKALQLMVDEYTVSAPMPKSQDCRTVKREAGRSREKPEEWKIKEVMRRKTTCSQESDRTYVGNKSCKVFPGKDGRKKARRWLAEKIVLEEGL